MEHFNLIQDLCRAALANPTNAVIHQVERLKKALEKDGNAKEAKLLQTIISSLDKTYEMAPSVLKRSFVTSGEELTNTTTLPVDKESSTPLAEVVFPKNLPLDGPVLNQEIDLAIKSLLNEWANFEALTKINAQPSRSCLIYGPPGTGKTHLALWIAKQLNMPVVMARLDGLVSSFLGTSSRNIGNLFSFAARYRCVLLLDEFDAIAKLRDDLQEVGEIKRVVNTLLQNLDTRSKIGFTIGVTNHEQLLDPAIWRRFETQILIPKPDIQTVPALLDKFLNPLKLDETEIQFLSWIIEGVSGADIQSLAKWIKKSKVLEPEESIVNTIRKFAVLNGGRVGNSKKEILFSDDIDLANKLIKESGFSQTQMSSLTKKSQSYFSKNLKK